MLQCCYIKKNNAHFFELGLENVSKFPDLLAALADKGWTDQELDKITGGNLLRVFKETEKVAKDLQKTEKPNESLMPVGDFMYPVINSTCKIAMLETIKAIA